MSPFHLGIVTSATKLPKSIFWPIRKGDRIYGTTRGIFPLRTNNNVHLSTTYHTASSLLPSPYHGPSCVLEETHHSSCAIVPASDIDVSRPIHHGNLRDQVLAASRSYETTAASSKGYDLCTKEKGYTVDHTSTDCKEIRGNTMAL